MDNSVKVCAICKREFFYCETFRRKYPEATDCFCGRASCRRNALRLPDKKYLVTSGRTRSFSDREWLKRYPIKKFRVFNESRVLATQTLMDGDTDKAIAMFASLKDDMLCKDAGMRKNEFMNRKQLLADWLTTAWSDVHMKNHVEPPSALREMRDMVDKQLFVAEHYRTRSVWRKLV